MIGWFHDEQENGMSRIFVLVLTAFVALSSLTACDASHMDPIKNGGDAPGDIAN